MPSYRQSRVHSLECRDPVFAQAGDTLRAVAHTMWVESVGALVVGNEQRPLGIISERDLVAQMGQGADLDAVTAEHVMTPYVVTTRIGDTLDDAAYEMLEDAIRHLPVMDDEGRVVGMVSIRDLLRPLLSDGPGVSE